MALVVFLRGVNVGGHRTFRPSVFARQFKRYDVLNIGAAGTFVIRAPTTQAKLRADFRRRLPFETQVMICQGREIIELASGNAFGDAPTGTGVVRFVSILRERPRMTPPLPVAFPPAGRWLLRLVARRKRFVFGVYRRHMKVIGYLGAIDKVFGVPVTTRNWNTINAIVNVLRNRAP